MPELEITNMVMVRDPVTGKVVCQRRVKSYQGVTFPGGHAEPGETLYDSAVREVKEETGLDIRNLTACGMMYWYNNKTEDRYFTYFYRTNDYTGTLVKETDEGPVFWASLEELTAMDLSPNFREYLPVLLADKYTEAYCSWNDDMEVDESQPNPWGILYR